MLRKSLLEHVLDAKYVENHYCEGKWGGSVGKKFQAQLPEVITYDFSMM